MKRCNLAILAILALALPCVAGESELTGVLKKAVKAFSPYQLELDGATGSMYLRGGVLKDVPDGTRIHVSGPIRTELVGIAGGTSSSFPTHWHVYMDVTTCTRIVKPFEKPQEASSQNKQREARR